MNIQEDMDREKDDILNEERYYKGLTPKKHNNLNIKNCSLLSLVLLYIGTTNQSQDILFIAAAFSIIALMISLAELTKSSNFGWTSLIWGMTNFFKHTVMIVIIICYSVGVVRPPLYTICFIIYCWMSILVLSIELESNEYKGDGYYRVINKLEFFEAGSKALTIITFVLINLDVINYKNQGLGVSAVTCSALAGVLKLVDDLLVYSKSYAGKIVVKIFEENMRNFKRQVRTLWIPMVTFGAREQKQDPEAGVKEDLHSKFYQNLRTAMKRRSSFEILSRWWSGVDCSFQEPEDSEWIGMLFKILCNIATFFLLNAFTAAYLSKRMVAPWVTSLLLSLYMMMALINIQNPKKMK